MVDHIVSDPGPPKEEQEVMKYPFHSLQELKELSPSRKHGLTEENEEKWRRTAINLIISAGQILPMDHLATIRALEFFHRYYAQYSMVTNDRFLMSMACMYLAGKVNDTPKSSRDIVRVCIELISPSYEEASRLVHDQDWMKTTRDTINKAERALLYQLGFRFNWATAVHHVIDILLDPTSVSMVLEDAYYRSNPELKSQLSNLCLHLANMSAKVPLILQYPAEAIAAACIWMGLKFMKMEVKLAIAGKPWYKKYGLGPEDLKIIADQISECIASDAKAANELSAQAVAVKVDFEHPPEGKRRTPSAATLSPAPGSQPGAASLPAVNGR